ncbi:MAG: B12-binding domain-containing radical SAM protein [Lachnospiraceae bacterium]|nr:B12-binding domain-containing radical SAM protein [Lachnospiraceae bacterium]MCI7594647.1 B12-binding domain-containing radical SAM protein [Lachnospiraceae bacterium]
MRGNMKYEGSVYRPPSEARSLIIQATIGCAHNTCVFCSMYRAKDFRVRQMEEIKRDILEGAGAYGKRVEKIFLADGDALCIPTEEMLEILEFIREKMPWIHQISSYATTQDLLEKGEEELKAIREAGLALLYIGAESGDDVVLHRMAKGVTADQIGEAGVKAKEAGFKTSVTLISGLGSQERKAEHAIESARLISRMRPDYLGFLTLMLDEPAPICRLVERGEFSLLTPHEVMEEMELFLSHVDSEGTIFRANHASNYVNLRGNLNEDRAALLDRVRRAKRQMDYKEEYFRGL